MDISTRYKVSVINAFTGTAVTQTNTNDNANDDDDDTNNTQMDESWLYRLIGMYAKRAKKPTGPHTVTTIIGLLTTSTFHMKFPAEKINIRCSKYRISVAWELNLFEKRKLYQIVNVNLVFSKPLPKVWQRKFASKFVMEFF